jgi:membrane protease YdiL (CAAX protease family)
MGAMAARIRHGRASSIDHMDLEPWAYLLALGLAEAVSDLWQAVFGIWLHAVLAAVLLARGARRWDQPIGRFYLTISVMPLVRILNFSVSPHFLTGAWYYVAAEAPVLLGVISATRVLELPRSALGLVRPRSLLLSGAVLVSGLLAGWIERFIIQPPALAPSDGPADIVLPALLLIVFTGFTEEMVFRGLIQQAATKWLGVVPGIVYTTAGWALLHIGWHSPLDVLFVFSVGLLWGAARQWNGSTIDVSIAHGLANIMLFLVLPYAV